MQLANVRRGALILGVLGILGVLVLHWLVFFWVSTEATQGVVQRILYIHVPAAWVAFLAFGVVALCGAVYLWLGDDKLDMAAVSAAEGGVLFTAVVLLTGPIWGKIAWGTYWTWEWRLSLTLLLFFIYIGYFLVRSSVTPAERGKRMSAVVGIVGALNIPLIHMSVIWFPFLHPQPVVLDQDEGPKMPEDMFLTLMVGLLSFTLLFFAFFLFRYGLEHLRRRLEEERHRQAREMTE